ncbi:hypothetical protein BDU57DRAFT_509313 [Ampelomyces quisqualis]|uniref:Uncharacterized protein n=1 Tax=Ampelomyces quisqualis TaxID=50730 RepID=A0A6A5R230_AMPQU|nr:hypothetical protein BDU57DRAFT_509313 [Ampelomyces quisqualis]
MTAKVDLPVPRIPINTIEAFGLKSRRMLLYTAGGADVSRGVESALEFTVATFDQYTQMKTAYKDILHVAAVLVIFRKGLGRTSRPTSNASDIPGVPPLLMVALDLFTPRAAEAMEQWNSESWEESENSIVELRSKMSGMLRRIGASKRSRLERKRYGNLARILLSFRVNQWGVQVVPWCDTMTYVDRG